MGNCSSTSNCNPCGPNYDAINQLATKAGAYARQANTYSVDAANSATNAENSWLEFNALYLGAFAVAPTVDNEGDPLQVGALYWNSVSSELFAWNGTIWVATNFNEFTPFLATGTTTPRNLVAREVDVVNVKDFGAVGNGVTDDTAALQAALNSGGHVLFNSGTYLVTKSSLESLPDFGLKPSNNSTIEFSGDAIIKLESGVDVRHIIAGINVQNVNIINCRIDGNNSACNGIGFSGASNLTMRGGNFINIKAAAQSSTATPNLGGGRSITFQYNCQNIIIDGANFNNCFTCVDITGKITAPTKAITISNIVAENCNLVCTALATDSTGLTSNIEEINTTIATITNVSFFNCGSSTGLGNRVNFSFIRQNTTGNAFPWMTPARTGTTFSSQDWLMDTYSAMDPEWDPSASYNVGDRVKYTNVGTDSCLFAIDQSTGISISNVRGYNEPAYGRIGAIIRGLMKNVAIDDVIVSVNSEFIFRNGPVPVLSVTTRNFGRSQNIRISSVDNLGETFYVVGSDGPINVSNPFTPYYLKMQNIGIQEAGNLALVRSEMGSITSGSASTIWIHAANINKGGSIAGNPLQLAARSITDCNTSDPNGFKSILAGGFQIIQNETNNQLRLTRTGTSSGSSNLFANNTGLNCDTTFILPNAAWNGSLFRLGTYRIWVDSTGVLRIKGASDPTSDTDGTVVGTQT